MSQVKSDYTRYYYLFCSVDDFGHQITSEVKNIPKLDHVIKSCFFHARIPTCVELLDAAPAFADTTQHVSS